MNAARTKSGNITEELRAFIYLLGKFRDGDLDVYNALAPGYDAFARSWDNIFGKPALDRMTELLDEKVKKGGTVLDAGCGTGRRVPAILEATDPVELAALDLSPKMLEFAERKNADGRVFYGRGDVRHLPFADNLFDAVVSTWTVELIHNPYQVVSEYLRVIKPGGMVVYTFVTLPPEPPEEIADRMAGYLLEKGAVDRKPFAKERRPFHSCGQSVLETFRDGILSVVALGKCCSVEPAHLPCGSDLSASNEEGSRCA